MFMKWAIVIWTFLACVFSCFISWPSLFISAIFYLSWSIIIIILCSSCFFELEEILDTTSSSAYWYILPLSISVGLMTQSYCFCAPSLSSALGRANLIFSTITLWTFPHTGSIVSSLTIPFQSCILLWLIFNLLCSWYYIPSDKCEWHHKWLT